METKKRVANSKQQLRVKKWRLASNYYNQTFKEECSDNEDCCFFNSEERNESAVNEDQFFDAVDNLEATFFEGKNTMHFEIPEDAEMSDENYLEEPADEDDTYICEDEIEKNPTLTHLNDYNYYAPEYDELRLWAVSRKICQNHLDELLGILRRRLLPYLPKSSKTFFKTASARYNIVTTDDDVGTKGQLAYFGLEKGLKECINVEEYDSAEIWLILNADGIPLFNSGSGQFWPILCRVHYDPDVYDPFPVLIYYGASKPKDLAIYLDEFIKELNELLENGIWISGKKFKVHIKCLTCDTPARAFLKNIKGHNGYSACERCEVVGEQTENRTTYSKIDCKERSDTSFRAKTDSEHHNGTTPLEKITPNNINMVLTFVLDIMHLLFLGVMKKLLLLWTTGTNFNVKLGRNQINEISRRMNYIRLQVPCEFQRKPRSLKFLSFWKATEFRFFLLYCGPIVLRNIFNSVHIFKHFLLLHVACRILCTRSLSQKCNSFAKTYLKSFFVASKEFYGPASQIINFHNLIHVADDAINMKCELLSVSCFPFENMLGKIKSLLRSANRPLAQVCRRLHESMICKKIKKMPLKTNILEETKLGITLLKYDQCTLSTKSPDNVVILKSNVIFEIKKISRFENTIRLKGLKWTVKKAIFDYPCDSSTLNMWELLPYTSQKPYA